MVTVGKDPLLEEAGRQAQTKVKVKSVDPEWNESFVLMVTDISEDLRVSIWDYDMLSEDDEIGHVTFPLTDLASIDEEVRSI
jgi:Ca2+-dependent lipid-binding protein